MVGEKELAEQSLLRAEATAEEDMERWPNKIWKQLHGIPLLETDYEIPENSKTQRNTRELDIRQMTNEEMIILAEKMAQIASRYNLIIETCAEQIDLQGVGIQLSKQLFRPPSKRSAIGVNT